MQPDEDMAAPATKADLKTAFAELTEQLDRRFATMDHRFTEIDGRFAAMDQRFTEIDGRFAAMDQRITSELDRRFAAMDQRMMSELARLTLVIQESTSTHFAVVDDKYRDLP